MLPSHEQALEQLRDVEHASKGDFSIRGFSIVGQMLVIDLTVACAFAVKPQGLPLRARERFFVYVKPDFPFKPPVVETPHTRFAGFGHVQWMRHLCLYQSPETEWVPRDGMFGLLIRLVDWLSCGALGEFEREGAPLHPPVAYTRGRHMVIPRADTPRPRAQPWLGLAELDVVHSTRADIVGWKPFGADVFSDARQAAAAILLTTPMPFEYPDTVAKVFALLADRGVESKYTPLLQAAIRNPADSPLYVILGTPMRGVSGSPDLEQHLTAWRIDALQANQLRGLVAVGSHEDPVLRELEDLLLDQIVKWAANATVEWVSVRETRPAVTRRRDDGSPMTYFAGKAVAVWGCGALGGHIAEMLARAGVRRLILRDKAVVAPGLLVRQPFDDDDIGRSKAATIAKRVRRIEPRIIAEAHPGDLLSTALDADDWTDGADIVVDASASAAVLEKLEARWSRSERKVPVVNVVVDSRAERGMVSVVAAEHSGGPSDVARRCKVDACGRPELRDFADAFWPEERPPIFQPEPGCSSSTFRGSGADLVGLAASTFNLAALTLANTEGAKTAHAHFVAQPHVAVPAGCAARASLSWLPDIVSRDAKAGYEIRIARRAWREMAGWVSRGSRIRGAGVETGGVLFGECNDACRVIWVDEAIGPPPDSDERPDSFVCGTAGVLAAHDEKSRRTRGSVKHIGMWHTHPDGPAVPSKTDIAGMADLTSLAARTQKALLVILSTRQGRAAGHGAFVFSRHDFEMAEHQ